jgi:hypothetical protein
MYALLLPTHYWNYREMLLAKAKKAMCVIVRIMALSVGKYSQDSQMILLIKY